MNNVSIVGRLTKTPELKTVGNNYSQCRFTVAVDRRFKSGDGERQADFINCTAWRQTAEFVAKYFTKGQRIGLTGSIQTGSYEKDDGTRVYTTDVLVDNVEFVESKKAYEDEERAAIQSEAVYVEPTATAVQTELPFDL